jgi:hypothetical protein
LIWWSIAHCCAGPIAPSCMAFSSSVKFIIMPVDQSMDVRLVN